MIRSCTRHETGGSLMRKKKLGFMPLLLVAIFLVTGLTAIASIKVDDATIYVGESGQITLPSTYQRTLNQSTGISYQWRSSTSNISITSSTRNYCNIRGVGETTSGKIYFYCSYYIDGFYRTMDFYWDVVVKNSTVYITSITLSKSSVTIEEGDYYYLSASVYPTNATNQNLSWSSSNTAVATVSTTGKVTAQSAGSATIKCSANDGSGKYATCYVTVTSSTPKSISLPSAKTMYAGETITLTPTITPSTATTTLTWTSSNTAVATVNSSGKVTAKSNGVANIKVKTSNGLSATCQVTVYVLPESITTEPSLTLGVGQRYKLSYELTPAEATTEVKWTSANSSVVTVSDDGELEAKEEGETDITVTTGNGLSAVCHVTVPKPVWNLVVWSKSGEQISYLFSEHPKVTQTSEMFVVKTTKTEVEYSKSEVHKFTLIDSSVNAPGGIETVIEDKETQMTYNGDIVSLSNSRAGSQVKVYSMSGILLRSMTVEADGTLILDLSELTAGVYIISTESITYKIMKR